MLYLVNSRLAAQMGEDFDYTPAPDLAYDEVWS